MASFGQDLKSERESKGISLEEIADSTKISKRFLRFLEEDKLDMLPGKFITRGIIRTYAGYIGLDPQATLKRHDELTGQKPPESDDDGRIFSETLSPLNRRIWGFVIIVMFFIAIAVPLYLILSKKETAPVVKPPAKPIAAPEKKEPEPPPIKEKEKVPEGLVLHIDFIEQTWIQAAADGEPVLEGLKERGESFEIQAQDTIVLTLGNAGGITFSINGKEGKSIGSSNQVVRDITITKANYLEFLAEKEEIEE